MFCRNVLDGIYYIFVAFVTTFVVTILRTFPMNDCIFFKQINASSKFLIFITIGLQYLKLNSL